MTREQEALELIKNKDVNVWYLVKSTKVKTYKDYNSFLMNDKSERKLTEKEFNFLKDVFSNKPTKHLVWEDLEKDRIYKVLLNGSQYELVKRYDDYEYHCDYITLQKKPNVSIFIYEYEKEIFNDLRLERVEE